MTWTKKHDEFALARNFSESMSLITRYCLRRGNNFEPVEIELNLKKCNRWIGKHRVKGEYHRKTLATAISNLDDRSSGMFVILRSYTPWIHKILIRPLSFVEKLQDAKRAREPRVPTEKPMFDADHKQRLAEQQQQDISKLDNLFRELGMIYTRDALVRIWRLAGKKIDEVKNAIELMLFQNSTQEETIRKPHGWLISCLRNGWQKGLNLYYQVQLPMFNSVQDIDNFVDGIFERNQRIQT
jgi:hypothetical protein